MLVDNNCSFLAMQYGKQLAADKLFYGMDSKTQNRKQHCLAKQAGNYQKWILMFARVLIVINKAVE